MFHFHPFPPLQRRDKEVGGQPATNFGMTMDWASSLLRTNWNVPTIKILWPLNCEDVDQSCWQADCCLWPRLSLAPLPQHLLPPPTLPIPPTSSVSEHHLHARKLFNQDIPCNSNTSSKHWSTLKGNYFVVHLRCSEASRCLVTPKLSTFDPSTCLKVWKSGLLASSWIERLS